MPKTLVLIPTRSELEAVDSYLQPFDDVRVKLCGFGLVEATINTYRESQIEKPDSVILCGIAGTYDPEACPVGTAVCFESVSQFGIGCQREEFLLPKELGFDSTPDTLTLQPLNEIQSVRRLVSVTGTGLFEPSRIQSSFPDAVAEDMEGYGFALGAISNQVANISIVRSISNAVGEPFSNWAIPEALNHLGQTLQSHFETVAAR